MVGYESLQNVLNERMCSGVGMIYREGAIVMHFLYCYGNKQTNGGMHGEKSAGGGGGWVSGMISLYPIYTYSMFRRDGLFSDKRVGFLIMPFL